MRLGILLIVALSAFGATGEIVFKGTALSSSNFTGTTPDMVFDGDGSTWWASNSGAGWVGLDLGSGNTAVLTRYRIMPRLETSGNYPYRFLTGVQIQGSNDCTFATGTATLDTTPALDWWQENQYKERTATGSTPYRCFRVLGNTAPLQMAELRLIGTVSAGTPSAVPDAPTLSQWGGVFPAGSTTVTLTSLTTSASIRYTTDGSTPSNVNGSTYSAPISVSTGTTLKAVAYDASLSTTLSDVSAAPYYAGFTHSPDKYDDTGHLIQAFSGDMAYEGGKYYWFGTPVCIQCFSGWTPGVNIYSSASLYGPWHYEGIIPNTSLTSPDVTRTHVIWNASTSKWVMWAHHFGLDTAAVYSAPALAGPWTIVNASLNPDGVGYKDCNLFLDDNGDGYTVYTNGSQNAIIVSKLASDFLSTSGSFVTAIASTSDEAPVLFKRGTVYFLIASVSHSYAPGPVGEVYTTASSPLGTWAATTSLGNFNGQSTAVVKVRQKQDAYLYMSDVWGTGTGSNFYNNSREEWGYLTFPTSTSVAINVPTSWDLSVWSSVGGLFPLPNSLPIR